MIYEIPLTPEAQLFSIALGSAVYQINLYWCAPSSAWTIDLMADDQTPILSGLPLVTGTDLLGAYPYLNFGGQLVALTDGDLTVPPTMTNLGTTGHLQFVTTP